MENCHLNMRTLIERGEKQPWFMNFYLNYTENNENFLKSVPILIRNSIVQNSVSELDNAFQSLRSITFVIFTNFRVLNSTESKNMTSIISLLSFQYPIDKDKWQLVKRFFLIDIFSERNETYQNHFLTDDDLQEKYSTISYIRSIEIRFQLNEYEYYFGNKISVPLLIVTYRTVKMADLQKIGKSVDDYELPFEFKVTFLKEYSVGTFLHVSGQEWHGKSWSVKIKNF